jgi:DNA-directed RNA polymerase specialized sigma24 family protein
MSLHFTMKLRVNENLPGRNCPQEHAILFQQRFSLFQQRFSRCCPLLHFLAFGILGSHEEEEVAVQNCSIAASRNPPTFESEGAFRSWLARVLIDEALVVLRHRKAALPLSVEVARIDGA